MYEYPSIIAYVHNLIYKEKENVPYKKYFYKSNSQGRCRLFAIWIGNGPDDDDRNYEERMEEIYLRFEKAVSKYDPNPNSELLDLCNELTSETASVYMEIGLQAGMLLREDMVKNVRKDGKKK